MVGLRGNEDVDRGAFLESPVKICEDNHVSGPSFPKMTRDVAPPSSLFYSLSATPSGGSDSNQTRFTRTLGRYTTKWMVPDSIYDISTWDMRWFLPYLSVNEIMKLRGSLADTYFLPFLRKTKAENISRVTLDHASNGKEGWWDGASQSLSNFKI